MGTESAEARVAASPLGRHSFLRGVHFNACKKRLLKATSSSEEEASRIVGGEERAPVRVRRAYVQKCTRQEEGVLFARRRVKNLLIYDARADTYRFV